MNIVNKKLIFLLFSFVFLVSPIKNVHAIDIIPSSEDFEIRLTPEYPEPNTTTKAKIVSFTFNVDASNITWSLNGKIIEQGLGKKEVEFETGNIGSILSLSVFVITNNNQQVENKKEFRVVETDILWDANTYTPFFYKGKSESIIYNKIDVTALPHGFSSNKNNLIYTWNKNYKKEVDFSGTGKDTYSFIFSELRDSEKIGVEITNLDKTEVYKKTITITKRDPEVLFYEEHPLEGPLFQKAILDNFEVKQQDTVARAEPYFFPKEDVNNISFNWSIGGKTISTLSRKNIIGLTVPINSDGESTINLVVKNTQKLFQEIASNFNIKF